ncbi:MAG TPA: MAE_28990/MAE_18760 family HEPN-like nuclease [Burkholderiales bacterium]|nr:MAE_28990/MAE_18760 family HEPN-like nuclease [Burkholderiales bacterium]
MRIASPAQLASRLDKNLAWRKQELTQLKFLADSASAQNARVLRRAGIGLLYAHWEGFVKDTSNSYLKYLARGTMEVGKLKSCFVAIALSGDILSAGQAKKTSSHARLVDIVRDLGTPPPATKRIPTKGVISTRSNLKGEVLREIAATLGIDYAPFALKEKPVIDRLVQYRNSIVHGKGLPIQQNEYEELHREIISLMDTYKDLIQDAADGDGHLR